MNIYFSCSITGGRERTSKIYEQDRGILWSRKAMKYRPLILSKAEL